MRNLTEEELKHYNESLDKLFIPTGINIFDIEDGTQCEQSRVEEWKDRRLPTDKTIVSENGKFRIKETDEGYELWNLEFNEWLIARENVNAFRKTIGKVYKITR